jgi:hypothetical protein
MSFPDSPKTAPVAQNPPDLGDREREERLKRAAVNLETLIRGDPEKLAEVLRRAGLAGAGGPYRLGDEERPPTQEARRLADHLARVAIPAVERFISATGLTNFRPWPVSPRGTFEPLSAQLGLPLVGAFSEQAITAFSRVRFAERLSLLRDSPFKEASRQLRCGLGGIVSLEQKLWEIAATETQGRFEIPYAFRYDLLGWLWNPNVHAGQNTPTVCIRCGTLMLRHVNRENLRRLGPRCPKCNRDMIKDRIWPELAIAPAGPSTWWFYCQQPGCSHYACGDRRTKYCNDHKRRKQSPAQRRATPNRTEVERQSNGSPEKPRNIERQSPL